MLDVLVVWLLWIRWVGRQAAQTRTPSAVAHAV